MAAELVSSATSYKLTDTDWTKNIEICEVVAHDHKQAKVVIKAIKKRLGSKNSNSQLFSVTLLEMLMNNVGESVHKQVIDVGILPILVKIVKKKSDLPVREKIFLLLDAAQTSLGGASGRFPQYFSAYFELVNAGVQFPQRPEDVPIPHSSNVNKNPPDKESAAPTSERNTPQARDENVSGSSVLEKAGTALEVLRDVLIAVDTQHPEGAKDEFTLDLVEQCSFQKQRVMHLVMTSRDEKVVSQAIELNEQLERVLRRHDALLACSTTSTPNHIDHQQTEVEEEEEAEQLFRRIRKGKACLRPEDDRDHPIDRPLGLMGRSVPSEMLHRPLIRPLTLEPQQEMVNRPSPVESKQEVITGKPVVAIPPPPAKHVEREKFFQEHKPDGSTAFNGHMRNLSLHSRNASSSRSGSMDFSD
ncbi:TOM1-like protein 5 isoform X1 [Primulina huaijiensis]|uniref:TOM1-like protein 5 isoform X1 n=1 Tax=Primulina huaijiensis TaxID=1492673 RepID=UPI003CC76AB6